MRNVAYSQGQAEYALGPTGHRPTHPAGVVVLTRKIAGRPYGVAVARDGSTYVAANGLAFSPANRRPIRTVWVGGTPRNVTFDALGTTALVTTEEAVVFIR